MTANQSNTRERENSLRDSEGCRFSTRPRMLRPPDVLVSEMTSWDAGPKLSRGLFTSRIASGQEPKERDRLQQY
jgi:hypothetical protein